MKDLLLLHNICYSRDIYVWQWSVEDY